jgi:ComF family protein
VDGVLPVPLHFWRHTWRGYNQAELIAQIFCKKTGLPLMENVLARRRRTRPQTTLRREERVHNVTGAFKVEVNAVGAAVRGKRILLLDDVCTTGATLDACAQALKDAGAHSVSALTVARQTRKTSIH